MRLCAWCCAPRRSLQSVFVCVCVRVRACVLLRLVQIFVMQPKSAKMLTSCQLSCPTVLISTRLRPRPPKVNAGNNISDWHLCVSTFSDSVSKCTLADRTMLSTWLVHVSWMPLKAHPAVSLYFAQVFYQLVLSHIVNIVTCQDIHSVKPSVINWVKTSSIFVYSNIWIVNWILLEHVLLHLATVTESFRSCCRPTTAIGDDDDEDMRGCNIT